jgi:hypothetical protein
VGLTSNFFSLRSIPISTFLENNLLGGVMIPGTSKYEKRSPNPSGKIPGKMFQVGEGLNQSNRLLPF